MLSNLSQDQSIKNLKFLLKKQFNSRNMIGMAHSFDLLKNKHKLENDEIYEIFNSEIKEISKFDFEILLESVENPE
jgi:hypothetical protein